MFFSIIRSEIFAIKMSIRKKRTYSFRYYFKANRHVIRASHVQVQNLPILLINIPLLLEFKPYQYRNIMGVEGLRKMMVGKHLY